MAGLNNYPSPRAHEKRLSDAAENTICAAIWSLAEFDFRYNNRTTVGINDTMRAEEAPRVSLASAYCIADVTKPTYRKQIVLKFLRWRKCKGKTR
jgi:hypothetical protein